MQCYTTHTVALEYSTVQRLNVVNTLSLSLCLLYEITHLAMTHTHKYILSLTHTQQAVHCDDMNARMLEFSHTAWHQKRLALNYVQPQMVPPVTKVTAAPLLCSISH
jgi:hypothetical protein